MCESLFIPLACKVENTASLTNDRDGQFSKARALAEANNLSRCFSNRKTPPLYTLLPNKRDPTRNQAHLVFADPQSTIRKTKRA